LTTVFRVVPHQLLREFFGRHGLAHLDVALEQCGKRNVQPLLDAVLALPPREFDRVEADLHNVFDLACDTGMVAYIEAAGFCGVPRPADELPEDAGLYHKALWAWLNHRDAFENAARIHQVEQLAWWRKRAGLPGKPADLSPEALARLGAELSTLLLRYQGRGKRCTVEAFRRWDTDYLFAYPDDHVQNATTHDESGLLTPCTFRRTFQIVFAYDRPAGGLELCARGPADFKQRLEEAFASVVLGHPLAKWDEKPPYALDQLKFGEFNLATDPGDGVEARIRRMRLRPRNSKRKLTLDADPDGGPDDIHRMYAQMVNTEAVPLSACAVELLTITFEFQEADGRRAGRLSLDLTPRGCSGLRDQPPDRVRPV
jgi:hypothetical protein